MNPDELRRLADIREAMTKELWYSTEPNGKYIMRDCGGDLAKMDTPLHQAKPEQMKADSTGIVALVNYFTPTRLRDLAARIEREEK